jgi:excisionase family DNA binding protein
VSDAIAAAIKTFGWPPILRLRYASAYCQVSRWVLSRAVRDGELVAVRRGRTYVFRREDLDAWMLTSTLKDDETHERLATTARRAVQKRTATKAALDRLDRIAGRKEPSVPIP